MYFLRKKRQKRDLEAGLIFLWRGSKKHHLGKIIALMVAVSFFAFSVYAIKIDGLKAPLLTKREGVVIMLNEDDPNCRTLMIQVEERSPFPARWDPVFDQEIMARIDAAKDEVLGDVWKYDAQLMPLPKDDVAGDLASIIEPHHGLLGKLSDPWSQADLYAAKPVHGDLFIRAKIAASENLKARMPEGELVLPEDLISDDWFGQTFRFEISLESSGLVRTCIALPGGTTDIAKVTDREKELAAWVRLQRFKSISSEPEQIDSGQLELRIEASRE